MNETKLNIEIPDFIIDRFSYFVRKFKDIAQFHTDNESITYKGLLTLLQTCEKEITEHNKKISEQMPEILFNSKKLKDEDKTR
jgi:hypothetical protein